MEGTDGGGSLLTTRVFLSRSVQGEYWNPLIRRIDMSSGTVTTLAGAALSPGSTDGVGMAAKFYNPVGVAMDASAAVAIVVSTLSAKGRKEEGALYLPDLFS